MSLWEPVDGTTPPPNETAPRPPLRHALSRAGGWLLDRLLPPQCAACGEQVSTSHALCPDCFAQMPFIAEPVCDILGVPLSFAVEGETVSHMARIAPPVYRRARAVARHDGPARGLVHALKYADRHDCAAIMARMMVRASGPLLADADVIVPVPLHPLRQWQRRFNQSALLSSRLAVAAQAVHAPDALIRTRRTRPQVGLGERDRRANVRDAFTVRPDARSVVEGSTILLVDDVMTTGATIEASVRALMRAGAYAVDVAVFAKVVDEAGVTI